MSRNNENNLISIDEVIFQAKKRGVDFGKGDSRERLRYLTKIGLLSHARRKSFNGSLPNGAYPEYTVELLVEIDKQLKAGKNIQELKREKERESFTEITPKTAFPHTIYNIPSTLELSQSKIGISQTEKGFKAKNISEVIETKPKPFEKIASIFKIAFLVLISGGIVFFLIVQTVDKNFLSYFLASLDWGEQLVQQTAPLIPDQGAKDIFIPTSPGPYFTINAETDINAPLNVKERISTPALTLLKSEFGATLASADLTADRTYTFPNLSGIVCLATGNCVGIGDEITSPGGLPNRLAKFITSQGIGVSSIEDLYPGGIAITIDSQGNVGIGTTEPKAKLEVAGDVSVEGEIQATEDICTDIGGGKCLSQLTAAPSFFWGGGGGGIAGSGAANYLSIWAGRRELGNSIIYQSGSNIGIGTISPSQKLDVAGTIKMLGLQLPTGAQENYVLTSDASGIGTWEDFSSGVLPSGESGQTLRHNGTNWAASSFLYNNGTVIGIGTTSTQAKLTVDGGGFFSGSLTLATTTLPQLVLKYDDDNYLNFSINATQTLITASKKLIIDSLTGEIKLGDNVTLFNATSSTIWGATFVSAANDSTVRKSGELVFRASLPIFLYSVPAQTTSTEFVAVSREVSTSTLNAALPDTLPGTTRKFAFLLNFADDILTSASSTWLVDLTVGTDIEFYLAGQNLSQFNEGVPHLSNFIQSPENNWQLKVKVPSGKTIRIFNIFLLVYDQI